jgi:hypothetical protein
MKTKPTVILILAFPGRANTRFAPTMAREPALNVGANLRVRPKILQYFFYSAGNLAIIRITTQPKSTATPPFPFPKMSK